jgi:hypothetical protein
MTPPDYERIKTPRPRTESQSCCESCGFVVLIGIPLPAVSLRSTAG